jgi:hypothetical protein
LEKAQSEEITEPIWLSNGQPPGSGCSRCHGYYQHAHALVFAGAARFYVMTLLPCIMARESFDDDDR